MAQAHDRARAAQDALPPGTVNCLIWLSPDENFASRSAEVDAWDDARQQWDRQ